VDWLGRRESDRIEDRRGMPGGRMGAVGCGTVLIALVIGWLTGTNPMQILQLLSGGESASTTSAPAPGPQDPASPDDPGRKFVAVVLADTEDTWSEIFAADRGTYEKPRLVLFTQATQTGCGFGQAATGPFYCPLDNTVYLDLSFFEELERMGAPGDFARAYVIAHEVGHHVQNLTGIEGKVRQLRERVSEEQGNQLSVALELQADCFAGVWGHHGAQRGLVQPGDAEEGLRAAAAIGDDRLQKTQQRMEWLRRGMQSGDVGVCNTLEARSR
jgi:predicted metalloprotease